jgi:hypothetical protein
MAVAPASVWILAVVLGQSPEVVKPVPSETPKPTGGSTGKPAPHLLVPPPAPRPEASGEFVLYPAGDGSGDMLYDGKGFRARVATDGTVKFEEKRVTGLTALPFMPMRVQFGVPSLQSSLVSVLKGKSPPPAPELDTSGPPPETTQLIPEVTRYRPDPREGCRSCPIFAPALVAPFGRFDATDELARMNGKDPRRFDKANFLAATREMRFKMAAKAHADNVRSAKAQLPQRLESIACDPGLSAAEKRGILKALRDEMNASPDGREAAARISEFLTRFESADAGVACPAAR